MKKKLSFLLSLSVFALSYCFSSYAKESIAPVEVNVSYNENAVTLDDLSVSGSHYICVNKEFFKPTEHVRLSLRADSDYYFSVTKASQVHIFGADYVTASKRESSTLLVLVIDLPDNVAWLEDRGGWVTDEGGIKYSNSDGIYLNDGWNEIEGKYYYFDENGYILIGTRTPDGYKVNSEGEWDEKSAVVSAES